MIRTIILFGLSGLSVLGLLASAPGAFATELLSTRWSGRNAPTILNEAYESQFDRLPVAGKLKKTPWAGWYWPNQKGGITIRWNSSDPQYFSFHSPSLSELRAMSAEEIAQLSPAEKYDIFMQRYNYPLTRRVLGNTSKYAPVWQGICHGAAPASIHTDEPAPVTLVNADGIPVPFGSADVKGLLSYYYAWDAKTPTRQVGNRCNLPFYSLPFFRKTPDCADINPGSFHIILANQIGLLDQAFISELEPGPEVWNHAVFEFKSTIIDTEASIPDSASAGTARRLLVDTHMVTMDSVDPTWEPIAGTPKAKTLPRDYQYWLDLDSAGRIIGGEWKSFGHPDFVWIQERAEFTGEWSGLKEIYKPLL